ncbi:hypothetical protein [Raoultella ornithinolytica]|uniref:hypothetical protein n=1 Tax=Raoultella ornithinolytica TaxID=54291 RepID=UPI0015DCECD9|nr:hypothetical protein [Raoultella ornithinolytica]BBQ90382.1 hypothetical protein WP3W18E06_35100 [Raoultella ornithinolytica]
MNIETVNELIQSLESAGELSIKERKYLELAKAYVDREAESVALALTFEKCREVSGCPEGVDLQDHLRQLAAENVGLKKFIQTDCFVGHIEPEIFYEEEVTRYVSADGYEPETPATDRIVAGIKADGVEQAENECYGAGYICETLLAYAQQLREGADK